MNTQRKTILGMIAFALFLGIAYFAYSTLSNTYKPNKDVQVTNNTAKQENKNTPAAETSTKQEPKKYPALDFTVFDAQGNKVNLFNFIGKPIVLNFWASWCPPCKSEMPLFNKAYAEYKDTVVFMMVDLVDGQRETQAKGQKFVQDQGYSFPVYFDNEHQGLNTYGFSYIPTTILIDTDGNIAAEYQGALDEKTLRAGINAIKK